VTSELALFYKFFVNPRLVETSDCKHVVCLSSTTQTYQKNSFSGDRKFAVSSATTTLSNDFLFDGCPLTDSMFAEVKTAL